MKVLLLLFALPLFLATEAYACSCTPEAFAPACQKVNDSEVVFIGQRISESSNLFRVEKVIKGLAPETKQIKVVPGVGSCSTEFEPGVRYVMFASKANNEIVFSGMCHGSRRASEGELNFLNEFVEGKSKTYVTGKTVQFAPRYRWPKDDELSIVAGADVVLEGPSKKFTFRSDEKGLFAFMDVEPGQYKLDATLDPYTSSYEPMSFNLVKGGCRIVYPQLKAMATLSGQAIDTSGKPLSQVRIEVKKKNAGFDWYWTHKMFTYSDQDGKFSFTDLESGEYVLGHQVRSEVTDDGSPFPVFFFPGAAQIDKGTLIKLTPNQSIADIKLVFPPQDTERKVTIRIVTADGKPPGKNLLQFFTESSLAKNFEGESIERKFDFVAYRERTYVFKARYWVDDLSNDKVKVKRLLLAEPVTLAPGRDHVEIVLRLSKAVTEDDQAFYDY